MPANAQIPITDLKLYDKIKSGYTGGHVDVYNLQSPPAQMVYCYDVNSLYPTVMCNNDFPTGTPRFVEGHIDLNSPETFGFLLVRVTCPLDLDKPFLQVRRNGTTVAPVGTWIDWYFTEELKLAATLGYKFEVLEGVLFERSPNLFSAYVQSLYNFRKTFSKNDPRNLLCKLLLNSLYGSFFNKKRSASRPWYESTNGKISTCRFERRIN